MPCAVGSVLISPVGVRTAVTHTTHARRTPIDPLLSAGGALDQKTNRARPNHNSYNTHRNNTHHSGQIVLFVCPPSRRCMHTTTPVVCCCVVFKLHTLTLSSNFNVLVLTQSLKKHPPFVRSCARQVVPTKCRRMSVKPSAFRFVCTHTLGLYTPTN